MFSSTSRWLRRTALAVACTGTVVAGVTIPTLTSSASPRVSRTTPRPVVAGSGYLALGDSVTFGYREPDTVPPPHYRVAADFVGYPEVVGAALGLKVTNAACAGETSGSLINVHAQSNGCEHTATGGPGYRSRYPLHVKYTGSQLAFAVKFLKTHKDVRLVSLMIGANDAFICEAETKDHCASELPALLQKIEGNVTTILSAVRVGAGYTGQILILNYYSTDYANATDNAGSRALNLAQDTAAKPFGAEIGTGYATFQAASLHSGLNTCAAGLLTQLYLAGKPTGTCGVHPSVAGQALLAQAVEEAIKK